MVSQHWVALCSGRQDCRGHDTIQCENSIQKQTFTIRNLYYWQCLCSFVLLVGCGVVANVEGHKRKLCWPHTLCKERVVQQKSFRCRNSLSQKNSHLDMTFREGHSRGSFRSRFFLVDDGDNFANASIRGGREVADANVPNLAANAKSCNGVSQDHGQCV